MPHRHPAGTEWWNSMNTCDSSKAGHQIDKPTQLDTAGAKRLLMNAIKIRSMDGLCPKTTAGKCFFPNSLRFI
jgi:hypothetical protein